MAKLSLRAARINAGLNQKNAAEQLKISISTLGHWERGESFPTVDKVQELCELYGVSYDDIIFLHGETLKADY